MSSQVEICNIALSRIRAGKITSITEDTEEARACNRIYDQVVEHVLSQGAWSTSIVRVALAKTTNTPAYGYTNEFQLPEEPKCIKVLDIDEDAVGDIDYKIEGDKLLTDEGSIKIRYIGLIEDPESYGPYLTQAIISRLASELSYTFSGSASLTQGLLSIYEEDLVNGLANDGQQGRKGIYRSSTLTDVRNSGGS